MRQRAVYNEKGRVFPKANYIAIEGQSNVALRALEKAQAEGMET